MALYIGGMYKLHLVYYLVTIIVQYRGVLPYPQRKRLWEKYRGKFRRQRASQADLTTGAQVYMKNSPMYQSGALGVTVTGGIPKVGQLQNAAWTLNDTCTFKIITNATEKSKDGGPMPGTSGLSNLSSKNKENTDRLDMPPPPSPASSTCSDTGSITNSHSK